MEATVGSKEDVGPVSRPGAGKGGRAAAPNKDHPGMGGGEGCWWIKTVFLR